MKGHHLQQRMAGEAIEHALPASPDAPGRPLTVLEAAEHVRAARVRYAEAFVRFKMRNATDGQAHQQALLETEDEVTIYQARLDIARWELEHGS
jgi:hypothetical protein